MYVFKKIICFVLVFILSTSFLFSSVYAAEVEAESNGEGIMTLESVYETSECYRYVQMSDTYDLEHDGYPLEYRIYNYGGIHEGVVYLNAEFSGLLNKIVLCTSDGQVLLFTPSVPDTSIVDFKVEFRYNNYWLSCSKGKFKQYNYNFDTNTFDYSTEYPSMAKFSLADISANNVLYSDVVRFYYSANSKEIGYSLAIDYQVLNTLLLKYIEKECFRLYLQDFHSSNDVNEVYENYKTLSELIMIVYDFNTKKNIIDTYDLTGYKDVSQDEKGNYYIDLDFSDLMNPLISTVNDGDYLLTFGATLKSEKYVLMFNNVANWTMTTNYQTVDYFRFKWDANHKKGTITSVDGDGNPIDPDEPEPPISDPNQGVIDALGGLGRKNRRPNERNKRKY